MAVDGAVVVVRRQETTVKVEVAVRVVDVEMLEDVEVEVLIGA